MSQIELVGHVHKIVLAAASVPTASAEYRGLFVVVDHGTGFDDGVIVCIKLANGTYAWKEITLTP